MKKKNQIFRILIVEDTKERQKILQNLYQDHAWLLVHTASRAVRLINAYDFDLISLDYDLAGEEKGDQIAVAIAQSRNNKTKVIIHSMNHPGANKISQILPDAEIVPFSKMIKTNQIFKSIKKQLSEDVNINWENVFNGKH